MLRELSWGDKMRQTAVWISQDEMVYFWEYSVMHSPPHSVAICSKISLTNEFKIAITLSGYLCQGVIENYFNWVSLFPIYDKHTYPCIYKKNFLEKCSLDPLQQDLHFPVRSLGFPSGKARTTCRRMERHESGGGSFLLRGVDSKVQIWLSPGIRTPRSWVGVCAPKSCWEMSLRLLLEKP